jgi:hypothetical protein
MQHLVGKGTPVPYIGRKVLKHGSCFSNKYESPNVDWLHPACYRTE